VAADIHTGECCIFIIRLIIAKRFPILEAARAIALLESGQITGNVVLLAPELL